MMARCKSTRDVVRRVEFAQRMDLGALAKAVGDSAINVASSRQMVVTNSPVFGIGRDSAATKPAALMKKTAMRYAAVRSEIIERQEAER